MPGVDVTLILGDTLIGDLEELPADSVAVGRAGAARDFCVVGTDDAGHILAYTDKPDQDTATERAVVGVYRFGDGGLLRTLLAEPGGGTELSALLRRYGARRSLVAVPVEVWWDLGSYDRYVAANRMSLTGRAGHSFVVTDDGTVVKRGEGALMAAQARWYRSLPDTAIGLAPRLLGEGEGWYRIELVDYPSLAELMLFEPLPEATWRLVLRRLAAVMESRLWAPTRREDPGLREWCERKYVEKTEQRLVSWKGWSRVRDERLIVNGVEIAAFAEVWPAAVDALRALAATAGPGSLVHGDMTFSNVLLARGYGTFKLLDPGTTFSDTGSGGRPVRHRQAAAVVRGRVRRPARGLVHLAADHIDMLGTVRLPATERTRRHGRRSDHRGRLRTRRGAAPRSGAVPVDGAAPPREPRSAVRPVRARPSAPRLRAGRTSSCRTCLTF
ncbi:sugar phosphate nucleotidyltransferase [Streptomyces cremeus]|uniref:sugar phosphate nucleotidyltransferase n=1 Tax=Streptomyces cremeus TaxID=66881 RepID=UPI0031EB98D8